MDFNSERQLQECLADWLSTLGHHCTLEVSAGGGRIDILTQRYLIEVKLTLSRRTINEAAGQARPYEHDYPNHQVVIAGLTPSSGQEESYNMAKRFRSIGLQVWYLDQMQQFVDFVAEQTYQPEPEQTYSFDDFFTRQRSYSSDYAEGYVGMVVVFVVGIFILAAMASGTGSPIRRYAHIPHRTGNYKADLWHEYNEWDVNGAINSAHGLMNSPDSCDQTFGRTINDVIERKGRADDSLQDLPRLIEQIQAGTGCQW
jgi:hypothetical protein